MKRLFCVVDRSSKLAWIKAEGTKGSKYFEKKEDAKLVRNYFNSEEGEPKDKGFRVALGPDHWRYEK